jgi:iron complex outermembrane receptor protein
MQTKTVAAQKSTLVHPIIRRAVAVTLALSATTSMTSYADPIPNNDTLGEVVVTGLRHSLESALQLKINSDSITESVVAEDIGKLPDVSIAESLARLPGVAAQRVDGRAQDLSIRGMGPQFSLTLLNGNEMASTGLNRSFQYDQIPAELVNQLTVYKTSEVSLGNQGLAGTVDIQTLKPLSLNETKASVGARYETNSQGSLVPGISGTGNRLTASYVSQFQDHTVGLALGFSHLDTPTQKKYLNPWDYGQTKGDFGVNIVGPQANQNGGNGPFGWDGFENGVAATDSKRDAALAVIEFQPNTQVHSTINILHSQFKEQMRGAELVGDMADYAGYSPAPSVTFTAPTTQSITGGYLLDTLRGDDRDDKINSVDWNTQFNLNQWTLNTDLSYSKATRDESIAEAYASNTNPTNYTFNYTGMDGFSQVSSAIDLGNPANMSLSTYWGGGGGYLRLINTDDQSKIAKFSLSKELGNGFLRKLEFGASYSDRSKVEGVVGRNINLTNGTPCALVSCENVPSSLATSPVSLGFSGAGNLMYFDVLSAFNNTNIYTPSPTTDAKNQNYNWSVDEKLAIAFVKLGIGFDALIPWHGNVGAQLINTNQNSTGLYTDSNGNQTQNINGGTQYSAFLPAMVLTGDVTSKTKLRVGIAESQSRPQLSDLAAGITASVGATQLSSGKTENLWSGSGGNPLLHPWKSTDFDIDLETYYSRATYVAAALFDKQINQAIRQGATTYDFTGFVDPSGKVAVSNIGSLTAPVNVAGGYVRGVELSGQLSFGDISSAMTGFGFLGSVAWSESNLPGLNVDGSINPGITFDGLSKIVADATLFYEKNGWQLRVSERYRSGYSAFRLNAFKFVIDQIEPEALTDAQIGYTFQSGSLKNLELLIQGENLTNRPYVVSQPSYGQTVLSQYHTFGAQYLIGASYKF